MPASALFRDGDGWAVFRVENGTTTLAPVEIGRNNGVVAQVTEGLEPGQTIILYPFAVIEDGLAVARRVVN